MALRLKGFYTGYSAAMSDADAFDAADRWRPYSRSSSVLASGGLITALGGWTALLLAVDGIKKELVGGGNRVHYSARLVARCDGVIDQQIRVIDRAHPFAAHAHEVLGGGGVTITRLVPDEAA